MSATPREATQLVKVGPGRFERRAVPVFPESPRPGPRLNRLEVPCVHLGAETGEKRDCATCGGGKAVALHACARHGTCTTDRQLRYKEAGRIVEVNWCRTCPDYQAAPAAAPTPAPDAPSPPPTLGLARPVVRNLVYHLYPVAGGGWEWNLEQLLQRIDLFNGRRIVAMVTDHRTVPPEEVRRALGHHVDELLIAPNDPSLRETATFETLLTRVRSLHPAHVTLFAHAKGVNRGLHEPIKSWVEILYAASLDHWPRVEKLLEQFPVVGAFKKLGRGWPDHESRSPWHYSGSFYWFRNRDVFRKSDWARIDRFWGGVEPWPSLHFDVEEAGCLFHEAPAHVLNLYDNNYMDNTVRPAWQAWQQPPAVRVEIGGGRRPRGEGFVNVDRLAVPGVDHVVDFAAPGLRLPFADASVEELYSCHCLEHVFPLPPLLQEMARVARLGARVTVRVPHWLTPLTMSHDHRHVLSERYWLRICGEYAAEWWGAGARKFRLLSTRYVPEVTYAELRPLFPHLSDEQVLKYVPDACHEVWFEFDVVENKPGAEKLPEAPAALPAPAPAATPTPTFPMPLRLDLGGGRKGKEGFVNVDLCPEADLHCDLNQGQLPFANDSVEEVYSSHCFEHFNYPAILREIVRVCRLGARVEIRVPHWLSAMATCLGHTHTVSPEQVKHWTKDFIADWWFGCTKRLDLRGTEFIPGPAFPEAQTLFPHLSGEQVMRFVPDACHEVRYVFEVVPHAP